MTQYNTPQDIIDYIKSLEDRIHILETSNPLERASIDKGYLLLKSPDGKTIAVFGDLNKAGATPSAQNGVYVRGDGKTDQMGMMFFRDDGTVAFSIMDDSPQAGYEQYWAMWDSNNRIVVSSDADSGHGLARPYIPFGGQWLNDDTSKWPSTSSTSFVGAWDGYVYVQHPKVIIDAIAYSASGVPALQLVANNTVYGPVVTGSGSGYTAFQPTITLPTSMVGTWQLFSLQYKLASGTGPVAAAIRGAWGIQT